MKRYCIRSRDGKTEFFDILSEDEEGYKIRLTRISDGNEKITETYMTRRLFDICLKTKYIYELDNVA